MTGKTRKHYDVIVVGLGPTGATLANLLGMTGLSVLVLEREAQMYPLPRAVHFDDEVMRVFQCIGVADDLTDKVLINPGMRFIDDEDTILLDWPRPQTVSKNGWNASYRFHQPDLEVTLREALTRFPNVDVRLSHIVEGIVDQGEVAALSFLNRVTGETGDVTARYVVGCDGARSTVRQCMQVEIERLGFEQRWLVVDVLMKPGREALGDRTLQFCDPVRPATYCRSIGNRRRWEFALLEHETDAEMSKPENVWRFLKRWIGQDDAELERNAIYTFKSEVAARWRKGRLLIAGDAAHLTPPFMGQGLCAGVRDASNLAWKLVHCCDGPSPETLLSSYQTERKPNVTRYISTATRLGELINRMGSAATTGAATDPRDGILKMESIDSELGPGLGPSDCLIRGKVFPQFRLANGIMLDDETGYQMFIATDFTDGELTLDSRLPVLHVDKEPALRPILEQFGARGILVRPDRYILGSIDAASDIDRFHEWAL